MPTNILLVEREKEIKENRIANNMRQEVIAAKSQVFSVEKEKKAKSGFVDNETKLQKLAAAEKARREAAKAEQEAQKKMNKSVKPPPSAKSDANSRPPTGKPELEKVCTVVKVHEDGSVDLRLSNGEVVERIDPSKLERAGERPPTAQSEKPPPTASSRPPTGRISSRWTEETKAAATKAVTFAPPSTRSHSVAATRSTSTPARMEMYFDHSRTSIFTTRPESCFAKVISFSSSLFAVLPVANSPA